MTAEEFTKTKHFYNYGFVPPLDITKGGRYTHVTTCYCDNDDRYYEIVCDDNMNFYYCLAFPDGIVVEL